MPLRTFKCPVCGEIIKTLKKEIPMHCDTAAEQVLAAPSTRFNEYRDPENKEKGKSQLKDLQKILKERARNHSRDNDLHDLVQTNNDDVSKMNKWIKEDGTVRKKIDDK